MLILTNKGNHQIKYLYFFQRTGCDTERDSVFDGKTVYECWADVNSIRMNGSDAERDSQTAFLFFFRGLALTQSGMIL